MEGSQWTAEPWAPGEASSVVALPPIGVENHCNYARDYTVRRPSASRCRPNLAFAVTAVFTSVLTLIFAISLCFHPVVRATQPRTALRRLSAGVETPETPTSDGSPEYLCEVALSVGRSPSEMPESPELPVETTEPKEEATQMHDTEYNEKTPSTDASEGWNERGNNMPLEGENPMFTNPVTKTINESFPASPVEEEDESEVPSSSVEVIEISDSPEEERYPEVVIILDEDSVDCTKEIEMSPKVRTPTGPPVSPPSVKLSPLFYDKVVGKRERQTRLFDGFDEPPAKRLAAGEGEPDLAVEISRLDSLLDDPPRTAVDLVRTRLLHWPQPQPPYFPARVKLGDGVEYPLGHVGANALTLGRSKHGNYLTAGGFGDSIPNDIYLALFGIPDIDKSAGPRFEVPEAGESADQDQGPVVISSDSDDGMEPEMNTCRGRGRLRELTAPAKVKRFLENEGSAIHRMLQARFQHLPKSLVTVLESRKSEGCTECYMKHPFYRLPSVRKMRPVRVFNFEELDARRVCRVDIYPPLFSLREVLSRREVHGSALKTLLRSCEDLVEFLITAPQTERNTDFPCFLQEALGRRFLALDAVWCICELLGPAAQKEKWWRTMMDSVLELPQLRIPQTMHQHSRFPLVMKLAAVLYEYNDGQRPPPREVVQLKRDLFDMNTGPRFFRYERWNPWREDDKEATENSIECTLAENEATEESDESTAC